MTDADTLLAVIALDQVVRTLGRRAQSVRVTPIPSATDELAIRANVRLRADATIIKLTIIATGTPDDQAMA